MTARVDVAPRVLEWAVRRAGWDRETADRRAPKLAAWVSGQARPTVKQLEEFASKTHTPFGFLFLSEPPVETVPIPDMRTIANTGVREPTADLLDTIHLCQGRQDWYHDYAVADGADPLPFVGSVTIDVPAAEAARSIRRTLGLHGVRSDVPNWTASLRDLIDRIEEAGVLVMVSGIVGNDTHRRLDPEEFRGFALSDRFAPLIFVNSADSKAAQAFTVIHELAHIWLGQSALSGVDTGPSGNLGGQPREEQWCNRVAAEVLLPLDLLRSDYEGQATTDEIQRLARRHHVSTLVVLTRLFDAGLLARDDYAHMYEDEREKALSHVRASSGGGGNFYSTQPLRLSRRFAQAVVASTLEGVTAYRDAYRLLGAKKHSTFVKLADALGAR